MIGGVFLRMTGRFRKRLVLYGWIDICSVDVHFVLSGWFLCVMHTFISAAGAIHILFVGFTCCACLSNVCIMFPFTNFPGVFKSCISALFRVMCYFCILIRILLSLFRLSCFLCFVIGACGFVVV